jgi:hypothetical protein
MTLLNLSIRENNQHAIPTFTGKKQPWGIATGREPDPPRLKGFPKLRKYGTKTPRHVIKYNFFFGIKKNCRLMLYGRR